MQWIWYECHSCDVRVDSSNLTGGRKPICPECHRQPFVHLHPLLTCGGVAFATVLGYATFLLVS